MDELKLKILNPQKHISELRTTTVKSEAEKRRIANASKQFESLLTSLMLKSMTQTTDNIFGSNEYGGDSFDSIFHFEIANKISESKGLGIANMIYKKLTGENLPSKFNVNEIKINSKQINLNNEKTKQLTSNFITPSDTALSRINRFNSIIKSASEKFGVNINLIKAVILAESAGKENAISSANAKGLMQIIDSTAEYLGIKNVWHPKENIFGGTKYLAELLQRYNGNLKLALAGYNAGPANVEKYNGIPPFSETKSYINRVLSYLNYFENNYDVQ